MIDRIEQLITTLEQEINDGYNTLPDYQANNEGKTYVNSAQCTLNELQTSKLQMNKVTHIGEVYGKKILGKYDYGNICR